MPNSDEAIIGNLLDRIRARFNADPDWGVCDGILCRSDLGVLLDIISALKSDTINNTMNLEQLTADLAAMTAERDAAVRDMRLMRTCQICKHMPDNYPSLHGACADCDDEDKWEWRGPDAGKEGV